LNDFALFDEVKHIVTGDRREFYGHPLDNHGRTAEMWSAYLGIKITPEQVCWMMMLLKCARQAHMPARDNLIDIVGYATNIDMIANETRRRKYADDYLRDVKLVD